MNNLFRSASNGSTVIYQRANTSSNDPDVSVSPNAGGAFPQITKIRDALFTPENDQKDIVKLFEGIDQGSVNSRQFENKNSLLHEIANAGKSQVLSAFLKYRPEINIRNEEGDTPIISTLKACLKCEPKNEKSNSSSGKSENEQNRNLEEKTECEHVLCLEKLLAVPGADVTATNGLYLSAFSYATMFDDEKRKKYLRMLLWQEENEEVISSVDRLYEALKKKSDKKFIKELKNLLDNVPELKVNQLMFGNMTLLQATCKKGMTGSARRLISTPGIYVNFAPLYSHTPIQLACIYGRVFILDNLIDSGAHLLEGNPVKTKHARNLIHLTMKYIKNSEDAENCLKSLLQANWGSRNVNVLINEMDVHGRTPLYYAVLNDDDCTLKLLESGARLDQEDKNKDTPLMNISYSVLERYLNGLISVGRYPKTLDEPKKESTVIINFGGLFKIYGETRRHRNECIVHFQKLSNLFKRAGSYRVEEEGENMTLKTDFLHQIQNNNQLKELLEHPVFSIAIHFKWMQMKKLFYFNTVTYILHLIIFSQYLLTSDDNPKTISLIAGYNFADPENNSIPLVVLVNLFLIFFFVLESVKLLHRGFFNYLSFSNVLRLINIFLAISCMYTYYDPKFFSDLKSVSILLTWLDLGFTVGKHHTIALYVNIFKKTLLRLLSFLVLYLFILIGYALSFHLLFRSHSSKEDQKAETGYESVTEPSSNNSKNPFSTVFDSSFKTISMLSSLLSAEDIPFDNHRYTSHIIFISFIILATLALVSILTEIMSNIKLFSLKPFLYHLSVQVDIIKHYEDNYPYTLYTVNKIFNRSMYHSLWSKISNKNSHTKRDTNRENKAENCYNLEMALKGNKIAFKNFLLFEVYPDERLRIKNIDDNSRQSYVLHDKIVDRVKSITKNKISRRPEEGISSEEANEYFFLNDDDDDDDDDNNNDNDSEAIQNRIDKIMSKQIDKSEIEDVTYEVDSD